MRIVFMGTPHFAAEILSAVIPRHEVVAVISQPDRAKDRKGNLLFTPCKQTAIEAGIPVIQYERIRDNADKLKDLCADIFVTAAYGQILSREILDVPRFGVVNVHASLLPLYRGSSPIQSAILNGDAYTGVTIMQTAEGLDNGDILAARSVEIGDMDAGELTEALIKVGAKLLLETLGKIERGIATRIKQDDRAATRCKKITSEDARIDWSMSAKEVYDRIRAFNPEPVAFTEYNGVRLKIFKAQLVEAFGTPGEVLCADKSGLTVACKGGAINIITLQAPGKKAMDHAQFLNGNKIAVGDHFGR